MKRERVVRYKGKDLIVYFHVDRCTHVAECLKGAPKVFDSSRRPWVIVDNAKPDKVAEVILKCPTGALHFKRTSEGWEESTPEKNSIKVEEDGPLFIHGDIQITNKEGEILIEDTRLALCRCGSSKHMPLCDGAHEFAEFNGTGKVYKSDKSLKKLEDAKGILQIKLTKDGPLVINGPVEIKDRKNKTKFLSEKAVLCRCGQSQTMPFCDNSHKKVNFKT